MSLHAQISPEALAKLQVQQRNSTITSIIISVLAVLLIGLILLWFLMPSTETNTPDIVSYQSGADDKPKSEKKVMNRSIERKPSAPTTNLAKVISASTTSSTAIPMPDVDVAEPSTDFGDIDEVWEESSSAGFDGIPPTMRDRCSKEDREYRLSKTGGNQKCEDAVMRSLRWLKKTQNADGSWCKKRQVAMTGLAVLAYLGHCETPNSEEFGDSVTKAIVYLVNVSMKNDGKLADDFKDGSWPYEHGIATYALGEAATFCSKLDINIPNLNKATKAAGDVILDSQNKQGSWKYLFDTEQGGGDNSLGLWQIQALKACKHTGLWKLSEFKSPMLKALEFIKNSQNSNGGIGYVSADPGEHIWSMTGGGALAFQMWGKSHDVLVRKAAKYIRNNAKFEYDGKHCDLYRHYYFAQTMIARGGDDWRFYNRLFRDELLNNQNADGTYKDVGTTVEKIEGEHNIKGKGEMTVHYRTCLATFMLEVYYRFLPATGEKTR